MSNCEELLIGPDGIDDGTGNDKRSAMSNILAAEQKAVLFMGTLITQPGLKRTESAELLHLTLHQCARDGNVENMMKLISMMGASKKRRLDMHDDEDLSALHYAARYNHYDAAKALVDAGAEINDKDKYGATPLHFAARYKHMRLKTSQSEVNLTALQSHTEDSSVVMYLVSKGALVNAVDNYGCTPLHFAAMRGNELVTWELLRCKGIKVEAKDSQEMRPLHMAATHNEVEICRMLLEAGAELQVKDEDEATPLHYAAMEGSVPITQMLFNTATERRGLMAVNALLQDRNMQQSTPLHIAVENRSADVVALCLEKGADVNATTVAYNTPLHLAAASGNIEIIKMLLDKGARVNAVDMSHSTPLHKSAQFNKPEAVKFLIQNGAKINKNDKDNFTPLLLAACNGHSETIECLLQQGASLMAVDKNDKTALYWAAAENKVDALEVLLRKADKELIDKEDRYGNTALHIAAEKGFLACVKLLLTHTADIDAKNEEERTPLHLAAKAGWAIIIKAILKHDITTLNDEDEDGNTPLHLAALCGKNKAIGILLALGANIEARNCNMWTALDCAAAKGFAKTCRLLLEADAPVDPMDKSKTTPLHLASAGGYSETVNILLQGRADASIRDKDGNNCLDLAIAGGHKNVCLSIINSSQWQAALRNDTVDLKTGYRDTPMRKLIRKMPDVAQRVFNRCTTTNSSNPDDPKYEITFNYEFIDDMYSVWKPKDVHSDAVSISSTSVYDDEGNLLATARPYNVNSTVLKKNHPMLIMVDNQREDLLAHPLVTSLLRHKWNKFGRWVYYVNLLIYCVFLAFLTGFICTTQAPYLYTDSSDTGSCSKILATSTLSYSPKQHTFTAVAKYVVIVLAALSILRELIQIVSARHNYLSWENLVEWVTYVTSVLLVIDWNSCQRDTGIREPWQWQMASVTILFAWVELVLFIRKVPRFGIFVVMFTDIFVTFLKFAPVFFLFIVAMALSFFVLIGNQERFSKVGYSLVSISVMMVGELDYENIFYGTSSGPAPPYLGLAYVFVVALLFLMTVLIMNLLVGLAVQDIKEVQEKAVLTRLAMQVELALDVENILPQFIRRKFVVRTYTMIPNTRFRNPVNKFLHVESEFSSSTAILSALNPKLDDIEIVQANQDKIMSQLELMRQRVKQIDASNSRLETMLAALIKQNHVDFDEDQLED